MIRCIRSKETRNVTVRKPGIFIGEIISPCICFKGDIMIGVRHHGGFNNTERFLNAAIKEQYLGFLDKYGKEGVDALRDATPKKTGTTSESWFYEITVQKEGVVISWSNSNTVDGVNVAVILQYGHGKKNGGFVQGIDYINPAMKPIFDKIAKRAWKEVKKS